jgi:hypothetical protein
VGRIIARLPVHVQASVLLAGARVTLRTRGLRAALLWANRVAPSLSWGNPPPERQMRAVRRAGRWLVPGSRCLPQSIALTAMMRGRGIDAELVIGCEREGDTWAAHAWVAAGHSRYQPLYANAPRELARCRADDAWSLRRGNPA